MMSAATTCLILIMLRSAPCCSMSFDFRRCRRNCNVAVTQELDVLMNGSRRASPTIDKQIAPFGGNFHYVVYVVRWSFNGDFVEPVRHHCYLLAPRLDVQRNRMRLSVLESKTNYLRWLSIYLFHSSPPGVEVAAVIIARRPFGAANISG